MFPPRAAARKAQPRTQVGAVRLGQRRVSGVGGAAGSLGLHYGLLAVGCHLALRGAEQFVFVRIGYPSSSNMAAQLRLNRSFWALAAGGWALGRSVITMLLPSSWP